MTILSRCWRWNILIFTEKYESREARKTPGWSPNRWKGRFLYLIWFNFIHFAHTIMLQIGDKQSALQFLPGPQWYSLYHWGLTFIQLWVISREGLTPARSFLLASAGLLWVDSEWPPQFFCFFLLMNGKNKLLLLLLAVFVVVCILFQLSTLWKIPVATVLRFLFVSLFVVFFWRGKRVWVIKICSD